VAADARESTPRDTATLATVTDTELKESGLLRRCWRTCSRRLL